MATAEKKFSKAKWLETANIQMVQGFLSPREIDDALEIWVNSLDGKAKSEIEKMGIRSLNEAWLV